MLLKLTYLKANILMGFIAVALLLLPLFTDSRTLLLMLTKIFIFAVFAMSYDILLGYTGIVSFGHAMFFGIGAYSVGIFMDIYGPSMAMLLLAVATSILLSAAVSYLVGIISLRLKSHFFAMLTLAFSGLFLVLAEKWRSLTKGGEGFTFPIPDVLKDRLIFFYITLVFLIVMFLLLRRFTVSPLGRVLMAIRENEQRALSLGYEIVHYKVIASVVAGVVASLSGAMYVITLRFVNTSVFEMEITLNALLMTIIGGVGTLIGSIVGAALIVLAHNGLSSLAKVVPIFERWIIFFGLIYIFVVLVFPLGIVGTVKQWITRKR